MIATARAAINHLFFLVESSPPCKTVVADEVPKAGMERFVELAQTRKEETFRFHVSPKRREMQAGTLFWPAFVHMTSEGRRPESRPLPRDRRK